VIRRCPPRAPEPPFVVLPRRPCLRRAALAVAVLLCLLACGTTVGSKTRSPGRSSCSRRRRTASRQEIAGVRDATQRAESASYASNVLSLSLERRVLTSPDTIARAASRYAADSEQAWMLRQPHSLRRSFAAEAFGRGETAEQIWMLRQDDDVRDAYVREVLGG